MTSTTLTSSVDYGSNLTLTAPTPSVKYGSLAGTGTYTYTYEWTGATAVATDSSKATFNSLTTLGKHTVTCKISVSGDAAITPVTVTWEVTVTRAIDISVSGYVGNDTGEYYLDDIVNSKGYTIIEQIEDWLDDEYPKSGYDSAYITFDKTSGTIGGNLSKYTSTSLDSAGTIYFWLSKALTSTSSSSKAEFDFTLTVRESGKKYDDTFYGTLTIIIDDNTSTSSGDIAYTAAIGDDVYFDIGDFEDFYYDKSNGGTLKSVDFDTPSGGILYADGGKVGSSTCFVDPTSRQTALDGVYFSPTGTTAKNAKTVKFGFTAHGSKTDKSGTISITYLSGEAKDITYTVNASGTVSLDPSDFTAAYKEVTGKAAPTGMTIVFQNVPSYGGLTYTDSSRKNAKEITLKSSNIKSYSFTTRTTNSNQLGDVVYTGSAGRTDTIDYIAYSGGTPQFTGKVVFNGRAAAPTNLSVTFTCFGSTGANFTTNAFTIANSTVMNAASYLNFGVPGKGALTFAGASASGGVKIAPSSLGSVMYTPNPGFNGTDSVPFIVYDASGNNIGSGQINIVVSGNTATTTTTTPSTGVTNVSQFTDVPANAWYRTELADLVSKGIMGGKGNGKFDPQGNVKYGEALKMVLRAAGYTAPEVTGSSEWAINYKNLAVGNGWISSAIDLNADISRNEVAELVARVLGVPASNAASPFTDNANGYAVALYYTTPQILQGNGSGAFKGGSTLARSEICAIIYRMNSYVASQYGATRPDGV